ncbi:hypothetical protein ACOBR2_18950 [Telmatobacter bradus]|uniref:hypothetical protein n=1 Tax=Telmatobacter bradus TaxID=474953 RepID=UPI003B434C06
MSGPQTSFLQRNHPFSISAGICGGGIARSSFWTQHAREVRTEVRVCCPYGQKKPASLLFSVSWLNFAELFLAVRVFSDCAIHLPHMGEGFLWGNYRSAGRAASAFKARL